MKEINLRDNPEILSEFLDKQGINARQWIHQYILELKILDLEKYLHYYFESVQLIGNRICLFMNSSFQDRIYLPISLMQLPISDIIFNRITLAEFPEYFCQMQHLISFELYETNVTINHKLDYPNLEIFRCTGNEWTLSEVSFPNLRKLILERTSAFPSGIISSELRQIFISKSRLSHEILTQIEYLNKLHTLILDQNEINEFPKFLLRCQQLQFLYLRFNNIASLELIEDYRSPLRLLNLLGNRIQQINIASESLPQLQILNLEWNDLIGFPTCLLQLTNLQTLLLKENPIKVIKIDKPKQKIAIEISNDVKVIGNITSLVEYTKSKRITI
ncbi:MAG: hypothetical protein INQ03_20850 [Candidatus Heimdallarchaeota archaeon]|nr:hypothetical protein [Candidatus Heimdallarchaeota archaeon]